MIVTVTPNPAVDRTLFVDAWDPGQVMRAGSRLVEPSGKGVNVAMALHGHGHAASAVLPAGGAGGEQLVGLLRAAGLPHLAVPIAGETRTNVTVVEDSGRDSKINEPGPALTREEWEELLSVSVHAATGCTWLAACGSLSPGVPTDFYARLVVQAHHAGCRVAVDTSGLALREAILVRPDLIKPNVSELAEVLGVRLETFADVIDAARQVRSMGVSQVLVSLGPDGVLHVGSDGVLHGDVHVARVESTVGAGDAALAGFLSASADPRTGVAAALRWSAAAVQTRGTLLVERAEGPDPGLSEVVPPDRRLRRGATPGAGSAPP